MGLLRNYETGHEVDVANRGGSHGQVGLSEVKRQERAKSRGEDENLSGHWKSKGR